MKSATNPDGVPKEVVDDIRNGMAYHRSQFYKDITIPFHGFNRPGAVVSEGIRENWWRRAASQMSVPLRAVLHHTLLVQLSAVIRSR
jgi:hypothetical protein